jgi:hypothetical protein
MRRGPRCRRCARRWLADDQPLADAAQGDLHLQHPGIHVDVVPGQRERFPATHARMDSKPLKRTSRSCLTSGLGPLK